MSMALKLVDRGRAGKPIRVGLIGAGKFGTMFLSQAPRTPGLHVVAVADLDLDRARRAFAPSKPAGARSRDIIGEARRSGGAVLTDDADALIATDGLEVIVEATGDPRPGSGTR